MTQFDDIRPYQDSEVRPTLDRLLGDTELLDAVTRLKFPRAAGSLGWLLRPLVRAVMRRQMRGVDSVLGFQQVVKKYLKQTIDETVSELTTSGLDQLDPDGAYLFVSNHRDIAMDPAFVNWTIYHAGFKTLRIAIGDNLLTRDYVSDLMRLNKSFIVNRSAKGPREKLKAAKKLSAYIHHSIVEEGANIWIAQREGRAKDGKDKTNSAVIGMFSLNRPKSTPFADYIRTLNIVPVAISYEWDPCDAAKARELYQQRTSGGYRKSEDEDVRSIGRGITGHKGRVHVAFGQPLRSEFENTDEVVAEIDRQILDLYKLQPSHCLAWERLKGELPQLGDDRLPDCCEPETLGEARQRFELHLANIPADHRQLVLEMYANPVAAKLGSP